MSAPKPPLPTICPQTNCDNQDISFEYLTYPDFYQIYVNCTKCRTRTFIGSFIGLPPVKQ